MTHMNVIWIEALFVTVICPVYLKSTVHEKKSFFKNL